MSFTNRQTTTTTAKTKTTTTATTLKEIALLLPLNEQQRQHSHFSSELSRNTKNVSFFIAKGVKEGPFHQGVNPIDTKSSQVFEKKWFYRIGFLLFVFQFLYKLNYKKMINM